MNRRGRLFVISGPSGVGKSEIVKKVVREHPDVKLSVSCTTRSIRPSEKDGVNYIFLSRETFDAKVKADEFYEWANVHGNCYGTLKATVQETLDRGEDLILEIDVQGCLQAMAQDPEVVGIFIGPPSMENLEKRLRGRDENTEAEYKMRLGNAAGEIAQAYKYRYLIIHEDWAVNPNALQEACDTVYACIRAARAELNANRGYLDELVTKLNSEV